MQPPNPYAQQPQPMMYPQPPPRPAQRNVALIVVGVVLLGIGALAFAVFALNAYQYATAEDRFSDLGASAGFAVQIVKEASMRRMTIVGGIAGIFALAGVVLGLLGLRKR